MPLLTSLALGSDGQTPRLLFLRALARLKRVSVADELPVFLFLGFNALMAWTAWTLSTDIRRWRSGLASGANDAIPANEPQASEVILSGLPVMWAIGAVVLGALAIHWHMRHADDRQNSHQSLQR